MSECGGIKGAYSTQDVNVGWYGYECTKQNRLRIGPGEQFPEIRVVASGKRVGVQSTRNPNGIDDPPRRPPVEDQNGKQWAWVYILDGGETGWMKVSCLKERVDTIPWARGPAGMDFHVGLEPCRIGARSSCSGDKKNKVRTIHAREVYLRYAPKSTAFRYLQRGDSVRELYRRTAEDYSAVSVLSSSLAPTGARGWVACSALAGEKCTGIDVSNNQGAIDFQAVRRSGERFVICKATEGEGYKDPYFVQNIRNAQDALLKVGAYHFLRPRSGRSGTDEADDFLRAIRSARLGRGDIRPVVDVEVTALGPDATERYVGQFVGALRLAGFDAILYTYPAFTHWEHTFGTDLWIAHYGVRSPTIPSPWDGYVMWQYTSSASVPGVRGNCDRNKCPDLSQIIQH